MVWWPGVTVHIRMKYELACLMKAAAFDIHKINVIKHLKLYSMYMGQLRQAPLYLSLAS
jgi:hypothetical protein